MKRKTIKKNKRKQFACMVDAELLAKANAARSETWVKIIEEMLARMLT